MGASRDTTWMSRGVMWTRARERDGMRTDTGRIGIMDEKPSVLVKKFIVNVVALLVNPWVPVQVIARNTLGVDLTPKQPSGCYCRLDPQDPDCAFFFPSLDLSVSF